MAKKKIPCKWCEYEVRDDGDLKGLWIKTHKDKFYICFMCMCDIDYAWHHTEKYPPELIIKSRS